MRAVALAGLLALAVLVTGAGSARAQDTGWVIRAFDAVYEVADDGTVEVVETIAVDFGQLEKHGIYRTIPVAYDYSPTQVRIIEIEDVRVTASDGTPDDVEVSQDGSALVLRIGDPDVTVSGAHEYRISYQLRGALNTFEDHVELYWNVTGTGWAVPIQRASATVVAPRITELTCFAGYEGSTELCEEAATSADGREGHAVGRALGPGEGLTIVAGFPRGSVAGGAPMLVEKPAVGPWYAQLPGPLEYGVGAAMLVLGLLGLAGLVWRQGRDDAVRGGKVPVFTSDRGGVEFRPPEGLRPAQLGLLVDERVDERDVSATIVDLAVRGHLTINEIPKEGWFGRTDWELERTGNQDDELNDYERELYDAIFAGRDTVRVSELKGEFATEYQSVRSRIYADGLRRRWFASRPDRVRSRWLVAGIVLAAVGMALTVVAAANWRLDLAVLALPVGVVGGLLAILHRWMPRRTPRGSEMLRRARGFEEFIRTAETRRMEFAEREHLFVEYLPYAVAYDAVDRWATAFEGLSAEQATRAAHGYWYAGHVGAFDIGGFSGSLADFGARTGSSLAQAPASSGSSGLGGGGFSGGGFGGGGGGSW